MGALFVTAMSLAARQKSEQQLRETENRFRLLADSAPVLIWVNGLDGCEFVNRAYLEFVGVQSDVEVRGYDWAQFVHPEDRESYVTAYLDSMKRQAPFEAKFRFRRHDGGEIQFGTLGGMSLLERRQIGEGFLLIAEPGMSERSG